MGKRGPQPGTKRKAAPSGAASAAAGPKTPRSRKAVAAGAVVTAAAPALASTAEEARALSPAHRENPAFLTGDALRRLAHQHGIARSVAETMSDEKIREQLRYTTRRRFDEQHEEAGAA